MKKEIVKKLYSKENLELTKIADEFANIWEEKEKLISHIIAEKLISYGNNIVIVVFVCFDFKTSNALIIHHLNNVGITLIVNCEKILIVILVLHNA